jgi:signal transduction histidine kinase
VPDTLASSAAGPAPSGPGRQHNVRVSPAAASHARAVGVPARWGPVLLVPLSGVGVLGATVAVLAATPPGDVATTDASAAIGSSLTGVLLTVLAAVVLRHPDSRRFGWALAGIGWFWGLTGAAEAWVRLGIATDDALPGATLAAWLFYRGGAFLPATVALLALLFPTGRFLPGLWGALGRAALAVMMLSALVFVLAPAPQVTRRTLPEGVDPDPTTIEALGSLAGPVVAALVPLTVVSFVVPIATVVVRHRRSRGVERDRMRWLLWGALSAGLIVVLVLLVDLGPLRGPALFLCVNLVPAAMTVAVVNPSLVPIEDLLARTVVYGGLALLLVAIDLAVIAGLTALLGDALAQQQVVVLVLLLTVALYGPLRLRFFALVRQVMLGERGRPYDVVAGLASTLESTDAAEAQLAAVARAVASAFGVGYVQVEVDRVSGGTAVAIHGTPPAQTRTLPITYRDASVGRLVLPARGLRSRLSRRDERLLSDVVRQAAIAVRTGRLAEELQESRERLVVAREEERRRIRRDLHDGLGPALGGTVFQLESARLLVRRDPEAAEQQIATTSRQVREVVADVRRLVHDLRPPALDDRGLVGALRQQAELLPLPVVVDAEDLGALPAAVEVAAFRIVSEALTNVPRHASARRAHVGVRREGAELALEVFDDGTGIPADAQAGVGLVGLRERAAELGGRSEVTCPAEGGTVVRAWLPMRSTDDSQ